MKRKVSSMPEQSVEEGNPEKTCWKKNLLPYMSIHCDKHLKSLIGLIRHLGGHTTQHSGHMGQIYSK